MTTMQSSLRQLGKALDQSKGVARSGRPDCPPSQRNHSGKDEYMHAYTASFSWLAGKVLMMGGANYHTLL